MESVARQLTTSCHYMQSILTCPFTTYSVNMFLQHTINYVQMFLATYNQG